MRPIDLTPAQRENPACAHTAQHPVVRSFEPGETWAYCYRDRATL